MFAFLGQLFAVTQSNKKPTPKQPTKSRVVSRSKSSHRSKGRRSTATRYYGQAQPTADRYQQIQRALIDKGYFQGEPNGKWGADSTDALKRFQADQNLTSDGRLNSLSLIALGLGPKRTLSAQAAPAEAKTPPNPAPSSDPGARP